MKVLLVNGGSHKEGAKDERAMKGTLECFRGFAACLKGSQEKGVLFGGGLFLPDAVNATEFMQKAYEMGLKA